MKYLIDATGLQKNDLIELDEILYPPQMPYKIYEKQVKSVILEWLGEVFDTAKPCLKRFSHETLIVTIHNLRFSTDYCGYAYLESKKLEHLDKWGYAIHIPLTKQVEVAVICTLYPSIVSSKNICEAIYQLWHKDTPPLLEKVFTNTVMSSYQQDEIKISA